MKQLSLLLFLMGFFIAPFYGQSKSKTSLRVASYNLRLNTPADSMNAWPNRKEMVKDLIRFYDFDVFGVQEAFLQMLTDVSELKIYKWSGAGRDDGKDAGEHSAVFYKKDKFKLLDSGNFWYSETPNIPGKGWDATCCNRICSWVKLQDLRSNSVFYFFNSHFDHQGVVARRESAKLLNQKIQEIAGSSPTFSSGDYNAEPNSEPIRTILSGGILRDSYVLSKEKPYGTYGTFQGFNPNSDMKKRIDYVFVTKSVSVLKYATINSIQNGRFPSDHFPIVVDVEF